MSPVDIQQQTVDDHDGYQPVPCGACQSALDSPGRDTISFLLLDQFTIPLVGCDDHVEEFSSVCGLTSEDNPTLLNHHPAGGIHCSGCHFARHEPEQPIVPIGNGAVIILACQQHQSDIINRFHSGLQTRQQLTTSLDSA